MADITMCKGQDCPLKLSCYRHNATKGMLQSYFMSPPFKDGVCSHYWEDKEKQRELLKEIIQADEKDGLYDDWDFTLNDGLNEEE